MNEEFIKKEAAIAFENAKPTNTSFIEIDPDDAAGSAYNIREMSLSGGFESGIFNFLTDATAHYRRQTYNENLIGNGERGKAAYDTLLPAGQDPAFIERLLPGIVHSFQQSTNRLERLANGEEITIPKNNIEGLFKDIVSAFNPEKELAKPYLALIAQTAEILELDQTKIFTSLATARAEAATQWKHEPYLGS